MISFVVPAHNEQACLARTLTAIHDSARAVGEPYEIIVVNDASTDATADIAQAHHARVVNVQHRQIAATRNSGGRAAVGERICFVDADTTINRRALKAALRHLDRGAAGGGGTIWWNADEVIPAYARIIAALHIVVAKLISFTGGAFMFCRRDAFLACGGFDERLYWSEEGAFAMALKRQGRFVVLSWPVLTSGRRLRKTSAWQLVISGVRLVFSPIKTFTDRRFVEKIWYDSNRSDDDAAPSSLVANISNAVALALLLLVLSGPLWNFIPDMYPITSPLGQARLAIVTLLCHVGLIFWIFAAALLPNLLVRKHWWEWMKLAMLGAFLVWQAWEATQGVIAIWKYFLNR